MTEAEWLACTDPRKLLTFLRGKISDRKRRLVAVACCRRIPDWYWNQPMREAIDVAERYADGLSTYSALADANADMEKRYECQTTAAEEIAYGAIWAVTDFDHEEEIENDDFAAAAASNARHACPDPDNEAREQAGIIRDIFGNPFRPISLDPTILWWNNSTVVKLAQGIYEERRFADMPILADALEDAGCSNADILDHLRSPGPHIRGCWALDLLLGKE